MDALENESSNSRLKYILTSWFRQNFLLEAILRYQSMTSVLQ